MEIQKAIYTVKLSRSLGALEVLRVKAADIGCLVAQGVTKETTILVVGDQDIAKFAGHEKSSKHRKAERLIAEGHRLRIIGELDFKALVQSAKNGAARVASYTQETLSMFVGYLVGTGNTSHLILLLSVTYSAYWRRARDSNPRYGF